MDQTTKQTKRILSLTKLHPEYPNNKVQTARYTWWNFLPKNLLEQLMVFSNIYYIFNAILFFIPATTTVNSPYAFLLGCIVIFAITAIKDFCSDIKRKQLDNQENMVTRMVFHPQTKKFKLKRNFELSVGDVVLLNENEKIPSDMLLIGSSNSKGIVYVETKDLDGENNLKVKKIASQFSNIVDFNSQTLNFKGIEASNISIEVDQPTWNLYKFQGVVNMKNQASEVGYDNFLLRGCSLKNTELALGVVLYTGHQTKIFLNSKRAHAKFPKMQRMTNKYIVTQFLIQTLLALIFAGVYIGKHKSQINELGYLHLNEDDDLDTRQFFILLARYTLILTQIPQVLTIHVEIIRMIQSIRMLKDPLLSQNANKIKVDVYDHKLVEEIGQIKYIFSDKTGTLTTNNLELRAISIKGELFGLPEDLNKEKPSDQPQYVKFIQDGQLEHILSDKDHKKHDDASIMMLLLSICHSIYVDHKNEYHASSRDELTFVSFAKWCGYEFLGIDEKDHNTLLIKKKDSENVLKYQLLHSIELTSERKRMSVIVKDLDQSKIYLFIKGAESEIFSRLKENSDQSIIEQTQSQMISLSNHGLRMGRVKKCRLEEIVFSRKKVEF